MGNLPVRPGPKAGRPLSASTTWNSLLRPVSRRRPPAGPPRPRLRSRPRQESLGIDRAPDDEFRHRAEDPSFCGTSPVPRC
jgi:hypothetical protein